MFDKVKCERCGEEYRVKTLSENRGKHFCHNCLKICQSCGRKLPMERWFGQPCSTSTAIAAGIFGGIPNQMRANQEYLQKPWIGSGLCDACYRSQVEKEQEEQKLLREAQIARAKEVLETPSVWTCPYCSMVNRGRFCSNCGSPRKKETQTTLSGTHGHRTEKKQIDSEEENTDENTDEMLEDGYVLNIESGKWEKP